MKKGTPSITYKKKPLAHTKAELGIFKGKPQATMRGTQCIQNSTQPAREEAEISILEAGQFHKEKTSQADEFEED